MDPAGRPSESLPTLADALCDRFEAAWQAGQRPRIEDYLGQVPEPHRPRLLYELLMLEVEYRGRDGERPQLKEYQDRFPDHADLFQRQADLRQAIEGTDPPSPAATEAPPQGGEAPLAPGAAPPEAPRRLGRYEVLEEIAQGGMGAVLRVRDPELGRELAVKVLRPQLRNEPEMVRRFLEEAKITAQLPHPGIVPVHDIGRDENGLPFLAMKLVRGETLEAMLKRRASPTGGRPRFIAIFEQVCQAVGFAHSKGVVHRDLKPLNVMVGAFGEVQLMDWGLAKLLRPEAAPGELPDRGSGVVTLPEREGTQAGAVVGTPGYMSPEQARGEVDRIDRRSDVFALGAILCEVLTGKPPFRGPGTMDLLIQTATGELAEAFARLDGCGADAELVELAKKCLDPDQVERPPDAGMVARSLWIYQVRFEDRLQSEFKGLRERHGPQDGRQSWWEFKQKALEEGLQSAVEQKAATEVTAAEEQRRPAGRGPSQGGRRG
jgi:serine/threonine protein kinase